MQTVADSTVDIHDALRFTRRTQGVDHIDEIVWLHYARGILIISGEIDVPALIDTDDLDAASVPSHHGRDKSGPYVFAR